MKCFYLFFILLFITSKITFTQSDMEDYWEDDYEDYMSDDYSSPYEVIYNEQGLAGLIKKDDKSLIIPCMYAEIKTGDIPYGVESEYYILYDSNKRTGVFSLKDNRLLVNCQYDEIKFEYKDFTPFDEERLFIFCGIRSIVTQNNTITTDFYSKTGKLLYTTTDDIEFTEIGGDKIFALTYKYDDYSQKTGYFLYNVNTGELINQSKREIIDSYNNILVIRETSGIGVYDVLADGFIIKPEYDSIEYLYDIYAYKQNKIEIFDTEGKIIFPAGLYENSTGRWYSNYYKENLWCVKKNGKWGAVKENQDLIIPFEYDKPFEHFIGDELVDSFWVCKDRKWGLINFKGVTIIPFQYDDVSVGTYENEELYFDFLYVKKDNKWGCIRTNGEPLVPIEYENKVSYDDRMLVVKNGKWGCMNSDMSMIFDFKFDTSYYKNLRIYEDTLYYMREGNENKMSIEGKPFGVRTSDGHTYENICEAIYSGNIEAIKKFIQSGVDLNTPYTYHYKDQWVENDIKGYPVAMIMSSNHSTIKNILPELFELCIHNGINVNMQEMEFSLIQYIVRCEAEAKDKFKMLQVYIDYKGDINLKGRYGYTAIMELCHATNVFYTGINCEMGQKFIEFLIQNGADPNISDNKGEVPLEVAKEAGCKELAKLLKTYKQ